MALHFFSDMGHLVERRCDEPAEADHIDLLLLRGGQDFFARNHDAEVNHFVIVATKHDANDVLSDVVHVAFDGGHKDASLRLRFA